MKNLNNNNGKRDALKCLMADKQFADIGAQRAAKSSLPAPMEFELVPISALRINAKYQRGISDKGRVTIKKIIVGFDWLRFGALTLSKLENGEFAVIDGQHRAIAALHVGALLVPALIRPLETSSQAATFLGLNETRTAVGPIDRFNAKVVAGDQFAMLLSSALATLEIKLIARAGYDLKDRETRSIGALQQVAKKFGLESLCDALEMLIETQKGVDNVLTGFAVQTMVRIVSRIVEQDGDLSRLEKIVAETDFSSLCDDARKMAKMLGGQLFPYGAQILMRRYNKGLQKTLPQSF